ncbi:hypothetical protein GCM10022402_03260 [Salinactinospora qingdaonensis]|uniref:Uncharacterized protein n=1 Tax=Salinactinospora qingdaonensis TaxID=702744 RepID=A0ABP7EWW8_9ACTN
MAAVKDDEGGRRWRTVEPRRLKGRVDKGIPLPFLPPHRGLAARVGVATSAIVTGVGAEGESAPARGYRRGEDAERRRFWVMVQLQKVAEGGTRRHGEWTELGAMVPAASRGGCTPVPSGGKHRHSS